MANDDGQHRDRNPAPNNGQRNVPHGPMSYEEAVRNSRDPGTTGAGTQARKTNTQEVDVDGGPRRPDRRSI
jgi:hypothetical protein